jgi:CRISPR type I-A-associated protein Csa5
MSQEQHFWGIVNSLAAYTLYTGSYTLLDRLAYSFNLTTVRMSLYELFRNVEAAVRKGEISEKKEKDKPEIEVRTKERTYKLYGKLAEPSNVNEFINAVEKDTGLAKKVAAIAMSTAARARVGGSE